MLEEFQKCRGTYLGEIGPLERRFRVGYAADRKNTKHGAKIDRCRYGGDAKSTKKRKVANLPEMCRGRSEEIHLCGAAGEK